MWEKNPQICHMNTCAYKLSRISPFILRENNGILFNHPVLLTVFFTKNLMGVFDAPSVACQMCAILRLSGAYIWQGLKHYNVIRNSSSAETSLFCGVLSVRQSIWVTVV